MTLLKYRLFNKYNILIFVLFLLGMLVLTYFSLNLHEVSPWGFSAKDHSVEHLTKEEQEVYRKELVESFSNYDRYAVDSINMFFLGLPILVCSTVLMFSNEKKGLFIFKYLRGQNQKRVCISTILTTALITALTLYLAYVIYCIIGLTFCNINPSYLGSRENWDFMFGLGFGEAHPLLYYLLMGTVQVFVFSFVFSIFAYSITLLFNKAYVGMLIPLVYYFAGNFLFIYTRYFNLSKLRPGFTVALTGYANFNTVIRGFYPMIIPLIISAAAVIYVLRKREKIDY